MAFSAPLASGGRTHTAVPMILVMLIGVAVSVGSYLLVRANQAPAPRD